MDHDATLTVAEAQRWLADLVERAAEAKERVVLTRKGAPRAALVPIEDLKALEALEDAHDVEGARQALAEWRADPSGTVPVEELAKRYGPNSWT